MFNLDPGKLIVIAVVAIILLGPDKLPQVARQIGGAWRSFGEFRHRMEAEVRSTMPDLPPTSEIARLARSPAALLHHLSTMSEDEERAADAGAAESGDATDTAETTGVVTDDGAASASPTPLASVDGTAHEAGTNGSGPSAAPPSEPAPVPPEPALPADPNLN